MKSKIRKRVLNESLTYILDNIKQDTINDSNKQNIKEKRRKARKMQIQPTYLKISIF